MPSFLKLDFWRVFKDFANDLYFSQIYKILFLFKITQFMHAYKSFGGGLGEVKAGEGKEDLCKTLYNKEFKLKNKSLLEKKRLLSLKSSTSFLPYL